MKIVLPLPPNAANARMHWRVKHKAKLGFWDACDMRVLLKINPKAPPAPLDPARIAVRLFVHQIMDQDNAMARMKIVCDWLTSRGYIGDDAPGRLEWTGLPEQAVDRKTPRVELVLEAA